MTSYAEQSGGEHSPVHDELPMQPKGHQEWLDTSFELEQQRASMLAAHQKQGTDPMQDGTFMFLLGKLDVAHEQLTAHAGQRLVSMAIEATKDATE